ncbi:hypothetical protein KKE34_04015 [Patescibacteria group bacterium]|nr:hypothetical protein [Patescibacteria group bacterium]MBU1885746.1 hypothetical protein [Patescibacteria group bacterium]
MTLTQVLQDQDYSHRTQISLSNSMYSKLMKEKANLSLAGLIRKIITKYWQSEEDKMKKRQYAIQVLSEGISSPAPSRDELVKWQRNLRREKREHYD